MKVSCFSNTPAFLEHCLSNSPISPLIRLINASQVAVRYSAIRASEATGRDSTRSRGACWRQAITCRADIPKSPKYRRRMMITTTTTMTYSLFFQMISCENAQSGRSFLLGGTPDRSIPTDCRLSLTNGYVRIYRYILSHCKPKACHICQIKLKTKLSSFLVQILIRDKLFPFSFQQPDRQSFGKLELVKRNL